MITETEYVTIDNQLRFVLFGLECALDVDFSPAVVEQIFTDSKHTSGAEERYTLWAGPRLVVTGHVEDYEPEDILLTVESHRRFSRSLSAIVEKAKHQCYRLEHWQEIE